MARLEVATKSGAELYVAHFFVQEEISAPFEVWLQVVSKDADLSSKDFINQDAAFYLESGIESAVGAGSRAWAGICTKFRQMKAETTGLSTYMILIEPKLAMLRYRSDCRVFVEMARKDILSGLVSDHGVSSTDGGAGDLWTEPRPFALQYHETDLTFASRLMEEAGQTYLFKSNAVECADPPDMTGLENAVTLEIKDDPRSSSGPSVPYRNYAADSPYAHVREVQLDHSVRTTTHRLADYNFADPKRELLKQDEVGARQPDSATYIHRRFEIGSVEDARVDDGKRPGRLATADVRQRAHLGGSRTVRFETNVFDLYAGSALTIEDHPLVGQSEVLMVTSFTAEGIPDEEWHAVATAVFASEPWAPPRIAPKPRIYGMQSAVVVRTDDLGRVAVNFPWATSEEVCWLRMSHPYASVSWGMHALPVEGDEVLVGFLDGDPDQPIITGSLYNATHPPPYSPKERKTVSVWRDRADNELMHDAKSGEELVFVNAAKNLVEIVAKDHGTTVDGKAGTSVKEDLSLKVGKARKVSVGGKDSLAVTGDQHIKVTGDHGLEAKALHLKAQTEIVLEAPMGVTIKAGGNFVKVDPSGVSINGTLVRINSGGSAGSGGGASPESPDAPVTDGK